MKNVKYQRTALVTAMIAVIMLAITGGTAAANGPALRYYNEAVNGKVNSLNVKNCTFTNCYQGVYCANMCDVAVTGCTFDTTGHNAIALQSGSVPVDLGLVVIAENTFSNNNDRIIRFNHVGADSNITIRNNTAANSGDENNEVIKATSIAAGITATVYGNHWGEGAYVVNPELQD